MTGGNTMTAKAWVSFTKRSGSFCYILLIPAISRVSVGSAGYQEQGHYHEQPRSGVV